MSQFNRTNYVRIGHGSHEYKVRHVYDDGNVDLAPVTGALKQYNVKPERLTLLRGMVRRDSLKPGDLAVSSHFGARRVKEILLAGNAGQTTEIIWESPRAFFKPMLERYDSDSLIELVERA